MEKEIITVKNKRLYNRQVFIKTHFNLCEQHFLNTNLNTKHRTESGEKLIDLARKELGYSEKTVSVDIWYSLLSGFWNILWCNDLSSGFGSNSAQKYKHLNVNIYKPIYYIY